MGMLWQMAGYRFRFLVLLKQTAVKKSMKASSLDNGNPEFGIKIKIYRY